mmetsp:Transcript_5309/g.14854  ORF Transcript_5309/g.14854 Transcript_5309/m.14854 type:complete len:138 (+) Transcript_5309:371-784(+)
MMSSRGAQRSSSTACANLHASPKLHAPAKKSMHSLGRRLSAWPAQSAAAARGELRRPTSALCANLHALPKGQPAPKKSRQRLTPGVGREAGWPAAGRTRRAPARPGRTKVPFEAAELSADVGIGGCGRGLYSQQVAL